MILIISFIVISLAGLLNAGYLSYKHYRKEILICPFNHDCSIVTGSQWANILGVRNEILGLLFYIAAVLVIIVSLLLPNLASTIYLFLVLASGLALAYSIFLIVIQTSVIKNYCFYCLMSAFVNLLIFINSVLLYK